MQESASDSPWIRPGSGALRVLHVGCGQKGRSSLPIDLQGCVEVRLDISPEVNPDVVADMRDLSALEGGSFDVVYSSHNVEHVFAHEVVPMLAGWRRVLRPGGLLFLRCPDLGLACRAVLEKGLTARLYESASGAITPLDVLYGHVASLRGGDPHMAHKTGVTRKVLETVLLRAGFSRVAVEERPRAYELVARAVR
jgi:SAM-dependent methyltransferase